MDYAGFEYHVNKLVGDNHYNDHRHLLPSVHDAYRQRFLHTLTLGYKIPETLYHINLAGKLPDKNYQRYIKYVTGVAGKVTYAGY